MGTTIAVSEATRDELMRLKHQLGIRNMDDVIHMALVELRKARFREASAMVRARMDALGLTVDDVLSKRRRSP